MDISLFSRLITRGKKKYGIQVFADACQVRRNQLYNWSKGKVVMPHRYHLLSLQEFLEFKGDNELLPILEKLLDNAELSDDLLESEGIASSEPITIELPSALIDDFGAVWIISNFPNKCVFDYIFAKSLYPDQYAERAWAGESLLFQVKQRAYCDSVLANLSKVGLGTDFWLRLAPYFEDDKYPCIETIHDKDGRNVGTRFFNISFRLLCGIIDAYILSQSDSEHIDSRLTTRNIMLLLRYLSAKSSPMLFKTFTYEINNLIQVIVNELSTERDCYMYALLDELFDVNTSPKEGDGNPFVFSAGGQTFYISLSEHGKEFLDFCELSMSHNGPIIWERHE